MRPTLLIIDDDEDIRSQMRWALTGDYDVILAENRQDALEIFRARQPSVVLLDLGLPPDPAKPTEGFLVLGELLGKDNQAKVIIISGQAEKENALRAIAAGAYDFISKPVEVDELRVILKRAFHIARLEHEHREMQRQFSDRGFEGMLGNSPPMHEVFGSIRKVAATDAPVFVLGESGTGKEMVALAIHRRSPRKEGPFVAINCGAIPETLLESELFGHEKGAFTGAHVQRAGKIEVAAGGTLFLDEIGELPLHLQVKLLRFLQEQKIERVGGRKEIPINARVIAATNVDLKKAMFDGKFREDLYYRLAVVVIRLPALRDRVDDILLLAESFLHNFAVQNGKQPPRLSTQALRAIQQYGWPGNVRELENRIKRAVIMADGSQVSPADLELEGGGSVLPGASLREARESVEREMVQQALRRHRGKISAAATDLGISRPTLYELMEKLGIRSRSGEPGEVAEGLA
ncbi:MAG: PEP-CTERM-box response regulator transcription factor [Acidobacteria bacterium]|nr:PEP-CTERM-box response regulator transcription factor [Acidobacteriota bacterium]